jgi:2-keto-4-pentenoate hydratase/2-oxohepta-3-ene-1,7-dioic acid hydratase in catechol pathway
MKVSNIHTGGGVRLAVERDGAWSVLEDAAGPKSVDALVRGHDAARTLVENSTSFVAAGPSPAMGLCIPIPGKIICVGLNYRRHAREAGMPIPASPMLFGKFANSLAASGSDVPLPSTAEQYDYEAELGVVIGRRAVAVSEADALDYVWGYCNCNDVSARDLQSRTSQFTLGKILDGFLPVGPKLVSRDEVTDPQNLAIRGWLNGDLRQDANTSDMIFGVAELVSYISTYVPLDPGDLIVTGTPEGVILGRDPKIWMKPGDVAEVEVEHLGRLTTPFVGASW